MRSLRPGRIGFLTVFIATAASCLMTEIGAAKPASPENFRVQTKTFALSFAVGSDGRLYQRAVGAPDASVKSERADECYPQAGDGYIWEPALQVIHAYGNTSTTLLFEGFAQTNDQAGRKLTQIHLHDPAYPLEITLNFLADGERDIIEQWTEIVHHESGPVTLARMASTALLLPSTNVCLTHFFGDWAKEMLSPITEQITPGTKILDSKIGVRADQFQNPSFVLSLDGPPAENSGRVLGGSLEWSGSFQCAFENNGQGIRDDEVVLPDPKEYVKHPRKGGLGLLLMSRFMDEIHFVEVNGRSECCMIKRIEA